MQNINSVTEQYINFCHKTLNSNKIVSRAINCCKCFDIYDLTDMNSVEFSCIV
jgi:hypothetical protein